MRHLLKNALIAFSIRVENTGDIDANNVTIGATFGDGLRNAIAISNDGVLDGNTIIWEGISIEANDDKFPCL